MTEMNISVLTSIKGPEVSLEAVLEEASERLAV